MSTEEIIHAWKHNEDDAEQQSPTGEKPLIRKVRKVPTNPAGTQELSDADLEAVEGGLVSFTCNGNSC